MRRYQRSLQLPRLQRGARGGSIFAVKGRLAVFNVPPHDGAPQISNEHLRVEVSRYEPTIALSPPATARRSKSRLAMKHANTARTAVRLSAAPSRRMSARSSQRSVSATSTTAGGFGLYPAWGQPNEAQLKLIADAGFTTVLNFSADQRAGGTRRRRGPAVGRARLPPPPPPGGLPGTKRCGLRGVRGRGSQHRAVGPARRHARVGVPHPLHHPGRAGAGGLPERIWRPVWGHRRVDGLAPWASAAEGSNAQPVGDWGAGDLAEVVVKRVYALFSGCTNDSRPDPVMVKNRPTRLAMSSGVNTAAQRNRLEDNSTATLLTLDSSRAAWALLSRGATNHRALLQVTEDADLQELTRTSRRTASTCSISIPDCCVRSATARYRRRSRANSTAPAFSASWGTVARPAASCLYLQLEGFASEIRLDRRQPVEQRPL